MALRVTEAKNAEKENRECWGFAISDGVGREGLLEKGSFEANLKGLFSTKRYGNTQEWASTSDLLSQGHGGQASWEAAIWVLALSQGQA